MSETALTTKISLRELRRTGSVHGPRHKETVLALVEAVEAAQEYRDASRAYDEECSHGITANIMAVKPRYEAASKAADVALARFTEETAA